MMRTIFLALLLIYLMAPITFAQEKRSLLQATSELEKLRSELREVQAREADCKEKIRKLEVELQPENLQRAFSQTPSFNPEKLIDDRRQQLEGEKATYEQQLSSLADSRINLESSIQTAEGELVKAREPKKDNPAVRDNSQDSKPDTARLESDGKPQKSATSTKKKKARTPRRLLSAK